ncbi:MAG: hypothetical protein C0472_06450 [Erythrobacter sp.]|nr:hypothetical protein [Erythrobacter sp.]
MSKTLTPPLLAAAQRYAAARAAGKDLAGPVADFIAVTAGQAPGSIADADGAIARAANLWSQPKRVSQFERLVLGHKDDAELLGRVPGLAVLFLFHRNGFVREAALGRLSGPAPNPFLAAALAWRGNDWVDEVRRSARAAMARCLPRTRPDVLAAFLLETTEARATWRRWSDVERMALEAVAARPSVAKRIVAQLSAQRSGPLPTWLRHTLKSSWIDQHLALLASQAKVPGVRAIAVQALANGYVSWADGPYERYWIDKPMGIMAWRPEVRRRALTIEPDRTAAIRAGLADSATAVRKVALGAIIEHGSGDAGLALLAEPFLEDRSAGVRSKAAFILARANPES